MISVPRHSDDDSMESVKAILGPDLLAQVRRQKHTLGDTLARLAIFLKRLFSGKHGKPTLYSHYDGLVVVSNSWRIRGTAGYTLGNYLFSNTEPPDQFFIVHEYVHVLQWRARGAKFLWQYLQAGLWNWPPYDQEGWPVDTHGHNRFETQALQIEAIYRKTPSLIKPWQLESCASPDKSRL